MKNRIASIDIFRAITMFLMVFVNDLWTVRDVPHWLEHSSVREDSMGFSDVVFPAFLFIVGLSIPFAVKSRLKKSDDKTSVLLHILLRSLGLIVMGFFFVNHEYFSRDVPFVVRNTWKILMVLAFVLIWNNYPQKKVFKVIPVQILQGAGVFILVYLAFTYKPQWMSPHWWGILGLIGWGYLVSSVIYLYSGKRIWVISFFILLFHILNIQEFRNIFGIYKFKLIVSASNYVLVLSGVLTTIIYKKLKDHKVKFLFPLVMLIPALLAASYGFYTRPLWGISKILATPSWTAITSAINFTVFGLLYIISDIYNHTRWAKPILPAGRSTLTCYLLPVIVYAVFYPYIKKLPPEFSTGLAGILKSLFFALSIISTTWILEKLKINIKL